MATAIFWLTTTTLTTAKATGGSGSHGSGSKGPHHHHQQNIMIFSLRREPPLLVVVASDDSSERMKLSARVDSLTIRNRMGRRMSWEAVFEVGKWEDEGAAMITLTSGPNSQVMIEILLEGKSVKRGEKGKPENGVGKPDCSWPH